MILKVVIAFAIVTCCFAMPTLVDSDYTEITSLLEDGILSGLVIALMLTVVRGWTAIIICIIEAFLIGVAVLYGIRFDDRHTMYLAINYTILHKAAFWLELAIISIRTITGYRQIGADYRSYIAGNSANTLGASNRGRHQ